MHVNDLLLCVGKLNLGFMDVAFKPSQAGFSTTFLKIVVEVMTSGLPQVCGLCVGVSMGMIPVKDLVPKILKIMAVNHCGRQLA